MIFRGTSHYVFQKYTHITAWLLEGGNKIQQQLRHQRVTVMCIKNGKYRMRVGLHGSVTVTAQTARKATFLVGRRNTEYFHFPTQHIPCRSPIGRRNT